MYKDILGAEIKVGHIISVSRYGRGSALSFGIVTKIVESKKTTWAHFENKSNYRAGKVQLCYSNENISIVKPSKTSSVMNKTAKILIKEGKLPGDYILGEPVVELDKQGEVVAVDSTSNLIESLGAPASLRT